MKLQRATRSGSASAFTLIEIMVVVAIIGLFASVGIPAFCKLLSKHGMAKAIDELENACINARARAILNGKPADLVFYPREKRFEITGGGVTKPSLTSGTGISGQFDDDIEIQMLDINLMEYKDSDDPAKVRFFPDGTSWEMTLILRSSKNEYKKATLEVTTGIVHFGPVDQ